MTNGVSTKYLVLKQSGPTPQLLKEYVDAGGDKTKLIVLDWPFVSLLFALFWQALAQYPLLHDS
jgi:hypothetical protein